MANNCIGCGKTMGGVLGAYGVKLLYGEVCLSCNKKLKAVPNHQFLTPEQIKDIINNRVDPKDVVAPNFFVQPSNQSAGSTDTHSEAPKQPSAADEIRKLKQLMDEGIITPEEFEIAKRRLLGL